MWVFQVHASNATRFKLGFRYIVSKIGIPGYNDPKTNVLFFMYNWFDDEQNGYQFIILDNADDSEIFF